MFSTGKELSWTTAYIKELASSAIHVEGLTANVEVVTQLIRKAALELTLAYQREGIAVLGVYNDMRNPSRSAPG